MFGRLQPGTCPGSVDASSAFAAGTAWDKRADERSSNCCPTVIVRFVQSVHAPSTVLESHSRRSRLS
jgi:hypothetical protein